MAAEQHKQPQIGNTASNTAEYIQQTFSTLIQCALFFSHALASSHLVKIGDDLIEEPETLHALVVRLQLHVKLRKVADGGKHDSDAFARLVVQLVIPAFPCKKVGGYVLGQDVVEQAAVVCLQLLHLLLLLRGLVRDGERCGCLVSL